MLGVPRTPVVVKSELLLALRALVEASVLGAQDADKLTALVQQAQEQGDESDDAKAPAAAAYENHSGGIVETLQGLLDKAEEQLDAARKKEVNSRHRACLGGQLWELLLMVDGGAVIMGPRSPRRGHPRDVARTSVGMWRTSSGHHPDL